MIEKRSNGQLSNRIGWETVATVERRFLDEPDATTLIDREWRFIGFANLNFAKLIEPAGKYLKDLKIGARWNVVERRGDNDGSSIDVLPVITLAVPF